MLGTRSCLGAMRGQAWTTAVVLLLLASRVAGQPGGGPGGGSGGPTTDHAQDPAAGTSEP